MAPAWAGQGTQMDEIRKLLTENAVLPLWPQTGKTILGLSRGGTYAAAERGDIKTIQLGRLKRVPTAWLRQKLGLDEPPLKRSEAV
jgi:hypothetical protein